MSSQLTLLDTYCGEGGCTKGYQMAGFYVVGVDAKPMKRYCGDEFVHADAIEFIRRRGHEFDVIHASPPCQAYSKLKSISTGNHFKLIDETRTALRGVGKPYVIENVADAPLPDALMLCGTMFGLGTRRHRLFEMWPKQLHFPPATCKHDGKTLPMWHKQRNDGLAAGIEYKFVTVGGHSVGVEVASKAMQIDWMSQAGLSQAIPPAYTEYIGRWMIETLFS